MTQYNVLTFFIRPGHLVTLEALQVSLGPKSEVVPCPLEHALFADHSARQGHVLAHRGDLVERLAQEALGVAVGRRQGSAQAQKQEEDEGQRVHLEVFFFVFLSEKKVCLSGPLSRSRIWKSLWRTQTLYLRNVEHDLFLFSEISPFWGHTAAVFSFLA